ncbi:efflux RND transporter periplasmic adaptor subunit [Niveibacterium sp. 24ML]|uniref:efflux RND transporter periplasmic adaptor subunit n=1 Tax=Niveibacterium sp. 24ML TaxID=2985512 RepID=UPI0022704308|nr:efflux RND transporter periplasmic adaptor subunit [Niveibacterium sp. 24ML]MCX9157172.1 efflux RND transporter periplasmic adaptor subunit [Niveibacterium sp. 24ML]
MLKVITGTPQARRNWVIGGTMLLLATGGAVYALSSKKEVGPKADTAVTLMELGSGDTLEAKRVSHQPTVLLAGTLTPLTQIHLIAPFEGRVAEVSARPGDKVTAGQVLARFDESDLRARLAERAAALASAEEQMRVAERNRTSSRALLEQNYISKNAFDNTMGGFAERQAALDAQRAQLAIVQRAVKDARVIAPFSGTVSYRQVEPGQWVEPNRKLFSIVDLRKLEAEASIPSQYIAKLAPGQQVRLKAEGFGDETFAGTLTRINPITQAGTRNVLAYVSVDNPDERLRAGLYVSGEIATGAAEAQILLPITTIQTSPKGRGVWVLADGKLKWQAVEYERLSAEQVRVTKGLLGGERVVAVGLKGATENLAVRVKPAA